MGISELHVSEREAILGCLMFLAYRKQIMPQLAWLLALVITLLHFRFISRLAQDKYWKNVITNYYAMKTKMPNFAQNLIHNKLYNQL